MNAARDENDVSAKIAVLNTDTVQGTNLVQIAVDGSTGKIKTDSTSTISFTMKPIDPRDENYTTVWCFEGSSGLVYPSVATAAGALLISP